MIPFPIPLYGSNSKGYLTLMSQYSGFTSYRYSRILSYLSDEIGYDDVSMLDDPPWKKSIGTLTPPAHSEISFLLYVPVHEKEILTVSAEVLHLVGNQLIKIAEQPSTQYSGNSATVNAADPVHLTLAQQVWRHARVEIKAVSGTNLKNYIAGKGINQYYLFRLRMVSSHDGIIAHREENGYLLVIEDQLEI